MKKLMFALLLFISVPVAIWANQEVAIQEIPAPVFMPSPPIRFTIQDVLSVIADYDVKHIDVMPAMVKYYGATDYQYTFGIYIFKGDTWTRRTTLIHEIVHVLYMQKGLTVPEEQILADEKAIYSELFPN